MLAAVSPAVDRRSSRHQRQDATAVDTIRLRIYRGRLAGGDAWDTHSRSPPAVTSPGQGEVSCSQGVYSEGS